METRTCKVCGEAKLFARGTWVWSTKNGATGNICYACYNARRHARYHSDAEFRARLIKDNIAREMSKQTANPAYKEQRQKKSREFLKAKRHTDEAYAEKYRLRNKAWNAKKISDEVWVAKRSATAKIRVKKAYAESAQVRFAAYMLARKRALAKITRTPPWLTSEDHALIEAKYAISKWLSDVVGIKYNVDHIIPLRGKLVSGLHVPDNLCVIPAALNFKKNNKWEP